jgi:hypothetical protein
MNDEPLVKNPPGIATIPAECAHCGEPMVWVDWLYLVHLSTEETVCGKVNK